MSNENKPTTDNDNAPRVVTMQRYLFSTVGGEDDWIIDAYNPVQAVQFFFDGDTSENHTVEIASIIPLPPLSAYPQSVPWQVHNRIDGEALQKVIIDADYDIETDREAAESGDYE